MFPPVSNSCKNTDIPYKFPENAANAFGALYRFSQWLARPQLDFPKMEYNTQKAANIIHNCLANHDTRIGEHIGNELLECYGFNVMPNKIVRTAQEAASFAQEIGCPVVMKIVSPDILHKSEAGGVFVGLNTAEEVEAAFDKIAANAAKYDPQARIDGILVVKMAPAGEEVILGATRYPVFGPLLMFGTGGIFVEVFKDVEFGLAPITLSDARRMITGIKGFKLLQGFRGRPVADIRSLELMLLNLAAMVINHPEIKEVDINPLIVHTEGKGTTVADCRIIFELQNNSKKE